MSRRRSQSKSDSLARARRKGFWNIGTFLFAAVSLYLVIALILYLTKGHTAPYEITEGTIVEDSMYTGVIVRQEKSVKSPRAGYLNYYLDDKSKSGLGQHVCAISGESLADDLKEAQGDKQKLSSAQEAVLLSSIQNYVSSSDSRNYARLYDLHEEIESSSGITSADHVAEQIDRFVDGGADIEYVDAPQDGLIVYASDSLDGLKADEVNAAIFDQKNFSERSIRQSAKVKKDDVLFKVITDENWSVIFPISEEMAEKLQKTRMIETRIGSRPASIWGKFKVIRSDDKPYGRLTYSSDMLRFAAQRFVTVELILQNDSGLKLPRSAVSRQALYEIPESFVITDPDTAQTGVQVIGEDGKRTFKTFTVFSKQGEYYYAKKSAFGEDTLIGKDNSSETYLISKTKKLQGVYNINKGYAVFQSIDVVASNDMYYIVKEHTAYGPVLYDHIALNAAKMSENKVVHSTR